MAGCVFLILLPLSTGPSHRGDALNQSGRLGPTKIWGFSSLRENPSLLNSVLTTDQRVPHISLVFREMWDTTAANLQFLAFQRLPSEIRVSHISRKTSEIWGTLWSVVRRNPKAGCATPFSRSLF